MKEKGSKRLPEAAIWSAIVDKEKTRPVVMLLE